MTTDKNFFQENEDEKDIIKSYKDIDKKVEEVLKKIKKRRQKHSI